MEKKTLVLVSAVLVVISVIGIVLLAFEGGFGGRGFGHEDTFPRSLLLMLVIVPLVIAILIIVYAIAFPKIEEKKVETKPDWAPAETQGETTLTAVTRILNEDERRVVETLAVAEGNTMLQKDIRWKTGLTRVKTHRVLARLAGRGIVSVEKYYNTNKITLADWLRKREVG